MRILGLDQSLTRCGVCLLTGSRARPEFLCDSFASQSARHFGQQLLVLLDDWEPTYVVWERPVPRIFAYGKKTLVGQVSTPNADQLVLPRLAGMIEQACLDRLLPYEEVASNTWRARVLGKGYGNMGSKEAKAAAVAYARQLVIPAANPDQAEAALIALYGLGSDQFRMLENDARKTAEADRAKTALNALKSGPQSSGK